MYVKFLVFRPKTPMPKEGIEPSNGTKKQRFYYQKQGSSNFISNDHFNINLIIATA